MTDQFKSDNITLERDVFLLVGLGNPGHEYRDNRHNLGFMVIDALARKYRTTISKRERKSLTGSATIGRHKVIMAKPQTFMNRSGEAVQKVASYYRIENPRVLVIYDEIDLPFGSIRLREEGGSGGHNGMRSVIEHLGREFSRLRLGVGRPPGRMEPADFLLRGFKGDELPEVERMIEQAVEAVETFLEHGIEIAMTRHNQLGGTGTGSESYG